MAYPPLILNRNKWKLNAITTTTTTKAPSLWTINEDAVSNHFRKMLHYCRTFTDTIHSKLVPGQIYDVNGAWCPPYFDGLACWNSAPSGTIATQNCPYPVVGFNKNLPVYKECSKNGTWLVPPGSNVAWTDYTSCIDVADLEFRTTINHIYVIGYWVSLVALLISLGIFLFFRTLQCTRLKIHMRLFTAIALNNILWIIWYNMVIEKVDVVINNKLWCQILHFWLNYFMVTTYFWMFCESLYLHMALVVVFVKDNVVLRWLKFIGWGMSFVVVVAYAIVRYIYGTTEWCWIEASDTFWIITVPVLILLLTSFGFLVNVVRVLITKLQPGPPNSIVAAKKAVRATLILIPLFGLHFLLMPLRPSPGSSFERIYDIVSALVISLQGLCVSILFCFTNHEVTTAAKAYWARIRNRNRRTDDIPMTGVTFGECTRHM